MDEPQTAPATPENAPKITKDDSFKTCRATPATRRQLRATPARMSILSGGKPFKEANSSHKKFNSRRKANGQHNDTACSNETFIRHEQDLMYDRDSLDPSHQQHRQNPDQRQNSRHFLDHVIEIDNVTEQVIEPRTSSPKFAASAANRQSNGQHMTPRRRMSSPRKASPRKSAASSVTRTLSSPKKKTNSPVKKVPVFSRPVPKPRVMATKPKPNPTPIQWNRYMSSTAKKPTGPPSSFQFKKPPPIMNSSVASSRRCLGQWNTPRVTRTQSFKSTAELERDYFTSLRSSRS